MPEQIPSSRIFVFILRIMLEVGGRSKYPGQEQSCIDGRQFTFRRASARRHIQEVIIKASVAGRIRSGL
jgi:hypothetical protein